MGRRLIFASAVLAATMLSSKCNSNQPKPIVNKSPAVETIQDGAKKGTSMSGPIEKKKNSQLSGLVPKPVEKTDAGAARDVGPVDPNPFVASEEKKAKEREEKKDPYSGEMGPMKMIDTKRSDYNPTHTWYDVDDDGNRIYGKEKKEE